LSRVEISHFSVSPRSVFRTLATLDDILSAYLSFASKIGKIVLTIPSSLLSRGFLYIYSSLAFCLLRSQLLGQLRVVGRWSRGVSTLFVSISTGHSPSIDVIHKVKAST